MYLCITLYYLLSILCRGWFKKQQEKKKTKNLWPNRQRFSIFSPCRNSKKLNHFPPAEIFNKPYAVASSRYENWILNYRTGRSRFHIKMSNFCLSWLYFCFIGSSSNFCHLLFSLWKLNLKPSNQFKSNECSDLGKKISVQSVPVLMTTN